MKTVKVSMIAYTLECPSCGHALAITWGKAYQCGNHGCANRTKYKMPTVELEVIDPPTPEKSDEPQSNI